MALAIYKIFLNKLLFNLIDWNYLSPIKNAAFPKQFLLGLKMCHFISKLQALLTSHILKWAHFISSFF